MSGLATPKTRAELMALLTEACELEHGLACSYLYAAFSLKQRTAEGGLDPDQARKAKFWASQIFFVASQEMMHLAQAWNLLTAIGGTPYCLRPNLPQGSRYYPLHARIALEPFGERCLRRFIVYETPSEAKLPWARAQASLSRAERSHGQVSIGELYAAIAEGFRTLPGVIVGAADDQVGQRAAQFYDLTEVVDLETALKAIATIVEQGEGAAADRLDCHFGVFKSVLEDFEAERLAAGPAFQPVRPVMINPVAGGADGYGAAAHPIKDPLTRRCAELFDALYLLMLQALAFGFAPAGRADAAARAAHCAIEMMTTAIRPLGDAICSLPAGVPGFNGGPGFGLTRFVALPSDGALAIRLIGERLEELADAAETLAAELPRAPQLAVTAARLRDTADRLTAPSLRVANAPVTTP